MTSVWRSRMGPLATLAAGAILAALNPGTAAAAPPRPLTWGGSGPLTSGRSAPAGPTAVPGEIVVGFRSGVGGSARASARADAEVQARRNLLTPGTQLVKVEKGQTVVDAIAALEQRPEVRYAEPNAIYHATATTPNDPLLGSLWGLDNTGQAVNGHTAGTADDDIDAPEAWDHNQGSGKVVAVVDSGVAWDHPDLSPNMWTNPGEIAGNGVDDDANGKVDDVRGWDFVDADNNAWDYNDHGTHVAGTIAARGDNGIGLAGVAWKAAIMPVRALNASGSGTDADITDAFTYAADNGAKVVNASLGRGGGASQAMSDAITNHPNTLFVVAAGNGGPDGVGDDNDSAPFYPCNYTADNLICVAATNNNDALAGFSNYGATAVDLGAPGVDIDSARPRYTDSFSDDFETGLGKWTVLSGPWSTRNVIGTTWLIDSTGNYANGADSVIRTASKVDVGDRTDCVLKFSYGTFLASGDLLWARSSTDGTSWTEMGVFGNTNGSVKSAALLGAVGNRYYGFRLTSNASGTSDGAYIDNVRVACPGGPYDASNYQFLNGTSMASPHVAGAAAVLFSAKPWATVAQVKAALLASGDSVAALSTKTVSGRRLNLNGALTALPDPTPTTGTATGVGSTAAMLTGSVNPNGIETAYQFEYWTAGDPATTVPATPASVGSGSSAVDVTEPIAGLRAATTYNFRVVAYRGATAYPGTTEQFTTRPDVVINELRGSGTAAGDDFVELFNRGSSAVDVAGYQLAARNSDGSAAGSVTLPAQTIAPRGTLLVAAPAYSLNGSAGADAVLSGGDVPVDGVVALFDPARAVLDAVSFTGACGALEGCPLGTFGSGGEYAFVRRANRTGTSDAYGLPTDTGDNGADFALVVPEGSTSSAGSALPSIEGVPGPQNLASAPVANAALQVALLDPTKSKNEAPNRVTVDPDGIGPLPQTLYLRRTVTNVSGTPLSRVQFRVTAISTARSDPQAGQAIVRLDSSDNTTAGGKSITPVTLERSAQTPLPHGGGLNAVVAPATPLLPGEKINVELALRVAQAGAFQVILNTEALRGNQ
jgi:subtilisin family serine protease